jgi:FAD:protein FMN transferase
MAKTIASVRRARPLLGTFVDITAWKGDACGLEQAVEGAFAAVERIHRLMSYHEPESDVSRLNRASGKAPVVVHEWTYAVLQTAAELQCQSNGLFNIAVGPTLERLGFLPRPVGVSRPRTDLRQDCAVELFAGSRARLRAPGSIDLGGIAKGFAVDQAIGVLREHGVLGGLVNAGGDLAGFGPHEHIIAIRDPRDPARLLARAGLRNAALASSGLHFGYFGRSQHCSIIDPRAKQPVTAISGATVRAASCTIADALTKVVMLTGTAASDVLDGYGASALFVTTTGEVLATADWQDVHSLAA